MNQFKKDVMFALRIFRKNPLYAFVSIVLLALGIGASSAIFSVANSLLFRPLPYPESDRIVEILQRWENDTGRALPVPLFQQLHEHSQTFESVAALQFRPMGMNLAENGIPERISGIRVTSTFFPTLGVKPILGRAFSPEEDNPGAANVIVLSYSIWKNRFGGSNSALGRNITLNNESYSIVGVMPEGFQYPPLTNFWLPMKLPATSSDSANVLLCMARLKDGESFERAQRDAEILQSRLHADSPTLKMGKSLLLVPLQDFLLGNTRPFVLVLLGAVLVLLLIACANLADLQLAQSALRRREFVIRATLGAPRRNLITQLLTECMLLSFIGGIFGLVIAYLSQGVLLKMAPDAMPVPSGTSLDLRVVAFTLVLSWVAGFTFSLGPALNLSKLSLANALKDLSTRSSGTAKQQKTSQFIVASEIALSCTLLIGAALFIHSFINLRGEQLGFNPNNVLTLQMSLPEKRFATQQQYTNFISTLLDRFQAIPGIQSSSAVTSLPLEPGPDLPFNITGRDNGGPDRPTGSAQYRAISPAYFKVMGIPLQRGSFFTRTDSGNTAGVAIINETLAKRYWPNEDPLGKQLTIGQIMGPAWSDSAPRTVVGIVGDIRDRAVDEEPVAEVFIPYTQLPPAPLELFVKEIPLRWVFRTSGDPTSVVNSVQKEVLSVEPTQAIGAVRSMNEVVANALVRRRFQMVLMCAFAVLALALAAFGIYGVMAAFVAQRRSEIAVRLALGASPGHVLGRIVRQGLIVTGIGLLVGLCGAAILGSLIKSMLYKVDPLDMLSFATVVLFLLGISSFSVVVPGLRASRIDPGLTLRQD